MAGKSQQGKPPLKHCQGLSLDLEVIPELEGESEILSEQLITLLADHLPPRIIGTTWRLLFSTNTHGFSLSSLYRKFQSETSSPTLLCIQDIEENVFGALVSCPIKLWDHFYGTGETFLFTCQPQFQVFKWSGENPHFARGNVDSLSIGAGEGKFGLWLDSNFFHGRSQSCSTFRNSPLCPGNGDFVVKTLEFWVFD